MYNLTYGMNVFKRVVGLKKKTILILNGKHYTIRPNKIYIGPKEVENVDNRQYFNCGI